MALEIHLAPSSAVPAEDRRVCQLGQMEQGAAHGSRSLKGQLVVHDQRQHGEASGGRISAPFLESWRLKTEPALAAWAVLTDVAADLHVLHRRPIDVGPLAFQQADFVPRSWATTSRAECGLWGEGDRVELLGGEGYGLHRRRSGLWSLVTTQYLDLRRSTSPPVASPPRTAFRTWSAPLRPCFSTHAGVSVFSPVLRVSLAVWYVDLHSWETPASFEYDSGLGRWHIVSAKKSDFPLQLRSSKPKAMFP